VQPGLVEPATALSLRERFGQPFFALLDFAKLASIAGQIEDDFLQVGTIMNRRLIVLVGIFVLLLGTMMILPALGKHKQRNYAALSSGAGILTHDGPAMNFMVSPGAFRLPLAAQARRSTVSKGAEY